MPEFAEERRAAVLQMVERNSSVQVSEVADAFGVSRVTARADLDALARDGKLRRTHGGAVSLSRTLTVSLQDKRVNVNADAKRAIAARASRLVEPGWSVLVDTGTTGLELVRALGATPGLTIVTADLTIADYVDRSMPTAEVVILGGALRKGHRYTSGPATVAALSSLRPDVSFVCPTAFSPDAGFMTGYEGMAQLKHAFLHASVKTYVLMDSSKIGAHGLFRFGGVTDAEAIVMEADPHGVMTSCVADTQTKLVLAPVEKGEPGGKQPAGKKTGKQPAGRK
ncbi:MAG: DeoR/GlpR family DNA-binding transcription regulator [Tractidigestivibacter sp.]|jgi:DeoR family fructose operon transcriptional repressor|uniref:DeoR/GlpR family DNA-binding transcription regulator n=1 Tax=Tractidigestivibacter sp. TaxID=2847320 RepID=UPI003D8F7ACA